MSFSPSWLALREPADRRARAPELIEVLEGYFSGRDYADILDLASGAGSSVRALYGILPKRQSWRLVDHDPGLLDAAGDTLAAWADRASVLGDALMLEKDGRSIRVLLHQADLAQDPLPVGSPRPDLVTASALFDLVSKSWIGRFVTRLAEARLPLYASLIYDGRAAWQPPHAADHAMVAAFNAHQAGDKGFGTACGSEAAEVLGGYLRSKGFRVATEESPWLLGEDAAELAWQLNEGWAEAVRETGRIDDATLDEWTALRRDGREAMVGHTDLLALPGASS